MADLDRGKRSVLPGGVRFIPIEVEAADESVTVEKRGPRRRVRAPHALTLTFFAGYTPTATGVDAVELPIPYLPSDRTERHRTQWRVARMMLHVATAGGAPGLQYEYSEKTNAPFSSVVLGTLYLGTGENTVYGHSAEPVQSGGFARTTILALGTASRWTATLDLEEV